MFRQLPVKLPKKRRAVKKEEEREEEARRRVRTEAIGSDTVNASTIVHQSLAPSP